MLSAITTPTYPITLTYEQVPEGRLQKNRTPGENHIRLYEDRLEWREQYTFWLKNPDPEFPGSYDAQFHSSVYTFNKNLFGAILFGYNRHPYQEWFVVIEFKGVSVDYCPEMLFASKGKAVKMYKAIYLWYYGTHPDVSFFYPNK